MLDSILNKFRDPQTNWKYILIVVILALIVCGAIFGYGWWLEKKIAPEIQFSKIETQEEVESEKPKQEATKDEKALIFIEIFPDAVTYSDLDEIKPIKERAESFFIHNCEYVELDSKSDKEIIIIPQLPPKNGSQPRVGPLYVFQWEEKQWNLIGELSYNFRSWHEIGKKEANNLADIIIRNHWSAGSHIKETYKFNGTMYISKEKAMCGWDTKLEKELNCTPWP
jgi:hypothetical protein